MLCVYALTKVMYEFLFNKFVVAYTATPNRVIL